MQTVFGPHLYFLTETNFESFLVYFLVIIYDHFYSICLPNRQILYLQCRDANCLKTKRILFNLYLILSEYNKIKNQNYTGSHRNPSIGSTFGHFAQFTYSIAATRKRANSKFLIIFFP